jgi:hypothetical protein
MADPAPYPADGVQDAGADRRAAGGRPRWVTLLAAVGLALAVLLVVMLLVGGDEHGPGRHSGSGDGPGATVTEPGSEGHTRPPGGHG